MSLYPLPKRVPARCVRALKAMDRMKERCSNFCDVVPLYQTVPNSNAFPARRSATPRCIPIRRACLRGERGQLRNRWPMKAEQAEGKPLPKLRQLQKNVDVTAWDRSTCTGVITSTDEERRLPQPGRTARPPPFPSACARIVPCGRG